MLPLRLAEKPGVPAMSLAIRNAPALAPVRRRSIAFAPSAKPNAIAVLLSILATAEPAISRDLRRSSGPMPSRSSEKPLGEIVPLADRHGDRSAARPERC